MRRELVLRPMPGDEGDGSPGHLANEQRRRGLTVRRLDFDLSHVVEERIEPRASEDADLGRGQADFSLEPPEPPEPLDVESDDEELEDEEVSADFDFDEDPLEAVSAVEVDFGRLSVL
jgi:hypothetical protein